MQKKLLLLALAFVLLTPFTFGQNAAPVVHTEGIVVLKAYDPAVPSFITDMRGQFIFTRVDAQGNLLGNLWKYDPVNSGWIAVNNLPASPGELLKVSGTTNTSVVNPGSLIEAVYWKDASGAFWCLSSIKADLPDIAVLEKAWAAKNNEVLQTEDQQGNTVWKNKLSIGLYYK